MSNEQSHINPWAEKLQEVPMPDADASWKGMERLLNQHMPIEEKEKKRRFFFILFPIVFLAIGLVLLGGYIYTSTNTKQQVKQSHQATGNNVVVTTAAGVPIYDDQSLSAPAASMPNAIPSTERQVPSALARDTAMGYQSLADRAQPEAYTGNTYKNIQRTNSKASSLKETISANSSYTTPSSSVSHKEKTAAATSGSAPSRRTTKARAQTQLAKDNKGAGAQKNKGKTIAHKVANSKSREDDVAIAANQRKDLQTNVIAANRNKISTVPFTPVMGNSQMRAYPLPVLRKPVDPLNRLILKDNIDQLHSSAISDSVLQAMKKKGGEEIKKGWTFSVGVNHFMRINNQQEAPYKGDATTPDSEGLTGKITDYLPVPQARYHFNNKLFVQGELQFNAPQFTQPVQLEHKNYSDGVFDVKDTAYLKKLTYFNLPLSFHYSPLKRFYIGAGVQFSRLNNAIVLHEKTKTWGGSQLPDSSIKSSNQERIKDDTLFQKLHTSEFRLLADVNYQAGPLGVGVRYNHALRDLVKVPVAGGTVTQVRNSSLQLYIRYRLLDKRKRVQPTLK